MKIVSIVVTVVLSATVTAAVMRKSMAQGTPGYGANVFAGVKTDEKTYMVGEPVKVTFIVQNRSDQPVTYRFSSGKQFDVWVTKDGREVWRLSKGMMYIQALTSLTIPAGGSREFNTTWKQVDNDGKSVPPGAYAISAGLTPMSGKVTCVSTQITVGSQPKVIPSTVQSIVQNAASFKGKLVSIEGTYRGWRADGEAPACRLGPPVSRSDWAVSDKTGCIYVYGRSGLDPVKDVGKRVIVLGKVTITKAGQPYLEVRNVQVLK